MGKRLDKKRKNSKTKTAMLLLVALMATIGVSLALFSDFMLGLLTGTAGTLDIENPIGAEMRITRHHMVSGTERSDTADEITIINPGDIIEIRYGIVNRGNKSAWIRDILTLEILLSGTTITTPNAFELHPLGTSRSDIREGIAIPIAISEVDNSGTVTFFRI